MAFGGLQELLRRDAARDAGEPIDQSEEPAEDTPQKNPAAVALGRLGGLKGGKARAAKLTPEARSKTARKAVLARWTKYYTEKGEQGKKAK